MVSLKKKKKKNGVFKKNKNNGVFKKNKKKTKNK